MKIEKTELSRCLRLLDNGFSLITVNENKVPNIQWKEYQTKAMSKDHFQNFYSMEKTKGIGIITGFENLEVIDVDLKVIDLQKDRNEFWDEFLAFLKDNIDDFENKFIIVKTRNYGYHILYKCEVIDGNKKIARLKDKKEAIIESRGKGGYVWIYDQFVLGNSYSDIKYISENERMILWSCCKTYNYVEQHPEKFKDVPKEHHENDIKVWDDYNQKNSVWNLVSNEFEIVRKLANKTVIRRHGAKSPHSGYIFENSRFMYLFSTGTQYPAEKLLTPFHVYTIQKHYGNFSDAAKQLYKEGYGSRLTKNKELTIKKEREISLKDIDFPIDVFPDSLQTYISEVSRTLNASIDYLGSAMLWVLSICVGNSMKIEIKTGWKEAGVIWIAIVGRAGIGKTHNIQAITFPINDINDREVRRYAEQYAKFVKYQALSKNEKRYAEEIEEPKKTQFVVGDVTLEALFELHEQNKNAIGVLRDELSGWIKDLNKYRPGSDLETYLSCWSNQQIMLTRKTSKSSYVPNAFVPIIGGVQPSILSLHYTPENKDNGFIDRILLCYPELEVERYNESEMDESLLNWYKEYIVGLFDVIRNKIVKYDEFGNILSELIQFTPESKKEWVRIFNKITDLQNSDTENEYMKSILPKQKSYVARFSLLLNVLYSYHDGTPMYEIQKKAILGAEKLSDYFINMAKKNKFDAMEQSEMTETIKASGKRTPRDKFEAIYAENPDINRTKVADQLNVSRVTINNWIKAIKKV